MNKLRSIRIILSVLILLASTAFFICSGTLHDIGSEFHNLQIMPLLISESVGVLIFWLAITLIWGRLYCSMICPIGTLQDISSRIGKTLHIRKKGYRYKFPFKFRHHILVIYLITAILGLASVAVVLEPWIMYGNMLSCIKIGVISELWRNFGIGVSTGMVIGIISAIVIIALSLFRGRDFCNAICPIGTALSYASRTAIYHIEINPDKCTGCLKCEEICKSSCIKVVGRYVDNTRCVCCFDCIDVCSEKAINYQPNRNKPLTPLFKRTNQNKI